MITNRTIICLASDWEYDPTSKHQIMKILARCNHVVWVNYRGTRRPAPTRADMLNALSTLRKVAKGVQRVSSSMVQITPPVFPAPRRRFLKNANEHLVARAIRKAMSRLDGAAGRPVQIWSFAPDTAFLAGRFDEERFVYYCVDEHARFEGFDAEYVTREERAQIDVADVLITTSAALFESKSPLHPCTHLVRHGVDTAHFARAIEEELPVPAGLVGLGHPMIGFFGVLHHWIDCRLIAEVARKRPNYTFVLIGEVLTDVTSLRGVPNVHLLGRRAYSALPAYARAFDAAMLPFKRTAMTRSVNPIKMREYLAAGLAVASTPLPEARLYDQHIIIADGADRFARACDRVLPTNGEGSFAPPTTQLRRKRLQSVADDSWEAVVERLSAIVMQKTNTKEPPRSTQKMENGKLKMENGGMGSVVVRCPPFFSALSAPLRS
ncbi:MAG: glycosyltransferase [Phycisphaerae bacterium]|nr:glycosyltransferase [Phycisphaerae bacterium]